jgi:hypothetical protein
MSGLFQRIARRRGGDPDATTVPSGEGAATPAEGTGADAPAKRFIGATAEQAGLPPIGSDAAPSADAPTAATPAGGASKDAPTPAAPGETTAFTPVEQPTALFPLADQPTESHAAVPPPAGAPLSAAEAGSAPQSVAVIPGQQQLPGTDVATTGEQPAPGDVRAEGEQAATAPAGDEAATQPVERRPGFRERGRMRRRLRYLRRLRELQVRDLGGLAFDLRRFERKRDDLVAQKIDQIRACDDELHALETALEDRRDVRDVRLPGIGGACPRCFSIYGSSDRFCAHCGAALGGLAQGPAQVAAPPPPAPVTPLPAPSAPPAAALASGAPAPPAGLAAAPSPAPAAELPAGAAAGSAATPEPELGSGTAAPAPTPEQRSATPAHELASGEPPAAPAPSESPAAPSEPTEPPPPR